MVDLVLTSNAVDKRSVSVGYQCPCGCTPAVTYHRHEAAVTEGCCCGNEMAVGPDAATRVEVREGFELRVASVPTPWRDTLPVAWAIGPSTHPVEEHAHVETPRSDAFDPVCGMTVARAVAIEKGRHVSHDGIVYYFCGKGCKLDFAEDPARYLDPAYVPSM